MSELSPSQVLRAHDLRPKKSWGQNFLTDPQVHLAVIEAIGLAPEAVVVELGAGLGALTAHLLADARVAKLIAVERDPALLPVLRERFVEVPRLELLSADAGHLDFAALHKTHGPLGVVGNLPYHLACRIAVNLAAVADLLSGVGLLVQREVALRMAASPGNQRGLLSVLVQRGFAVKLGRDVPPAAFFPPPKVRSAIVSLQPRRLPRSQHEAAGRWVARTAFAGRRKTLLNTLSRGCAVDKERLGSLLREQGIDPGARPESLPTDTFFTLGQALATAELLPDSWTQA